MRKASGWTRNFLTVAAVVWTAGTTSLVAATAAAQGQPANVCVAMSAGGQQVAGVQLDLTWDPSCLSANKEIRSTVQCQADPATGKEAHDAVQSPSALRVLLFSPTDVNTIPDGNLFCCPLRLVPSGRGGCCQLGMTGIVLADSSGSEISPDTVSLAASVNGALCARSGGGQPAAAPAGVPPVAGAPAQPPPVQAGGAPGAAPGGAPAGGGAPPAAAPAVGAPPPAPAEQQMAQAGGEEAGQAPQAAQPQAAQPQAAQPQQAAQQPTAATTGAAGAAQQPTAPAAPGGASPAAATPPAPTVAPPANTPTVPLPTTTPTARGWLGGCTMLPPR